MSERVVEGEEGHGVGDLSVEPEVLVEREELDLWPQEPHEGSAYGEENPHAVKRQDETCASRNPHRVLQSVETRQTVVSGLLVPIPPSARASPSFRQNPSVPSKGEESPVHPPEDDVEDHLRRGELLPQCCPERHLGGLVSSSFPRRY